MNIILLLISLLTIEKQQEPFFTGEVVYTISGHSMVSEERYLIGSDFLVKQTDGKIKKMLGHQDLLYDLKNRRMYNINVSTKQFTNDSLYVGGNSKFHNLTMQDTITYKDALCKVVIFSMYGEYGSFSSYKYYYPVDHVILNTHYKIIGELFNGFNTVFRPFDEKFLPLRIEIDRGDKELMVMEMTEKNHFPVSREAIFKNYGIKDKE